MRYVFVEPGTVYNTWARAVRDFPSTDYEDCLELKEGDYIWVTNVFNRGWWYGTNDHKNRGWFHKSWVERCDSPLEKEPGQIDVATLYVEALQKNETDSADSLQFEKGDYIEVTHQLDNGRWKGSMIDSRGCLKNGWFLVSLTEQAEPPVRIPCGQGRVLKL